MQVKGPFRRFDHRHEFAACTRNGASGCMVRDRLDYAVGCGPLGRVADGFLVACVVRRMFAYCHTATERLLAQSPGNPQATWIN